MSDTKYSNEFETKFEHFTVVVEESELTVSTFNGKGSVKGTRAYMQMLDEILSLFPDGKARPSLVDLSNLQDTPLRSQLMLGRWMLKNRHRVDKVALVGAKAWERKLAQAIMKIARFKRMEFFADQGPAREWLGV